MAYTDIPNDTMDEILGGAGGAKPNDAQEAVSALQRFTSFITQLFNEIFKFFEELAKITKK